MSQSMSGCKSELSGLIPPKMAGGDQCGKALGDACRHVSMNLSSFAGDDIAKGLTDVLGSAPALSFASAHSTQMFTAVSTPNLKGPAGPGQGPGRHK